MRIRFVERLISTACVLCLAVGMMSSAVFAQEEEDLTSSETEVASESDSASADDGDQEEEILSSEALKGSAYVPYTVNGVQQGVCTIINGVPYVCAVEFCTAVGLHVISADSDGYLLLKAAGVSIEATAGQLYFTCNDRYLYVGGGVQIIDGKIFLPASSLAKCLGIREAWDQDAWIITVSAETIEPLESGDTFYNAKDLYWLSRVIYSEAGNQSLVGKIAVGDVVIHRVLDSRFSGQNTIYDVIFAEGQFDVVSSGAIYNTPSASSVIAAKLAMEGVDVVPGAIYFATYYFGAGYRTVAWIGAHCFMA